MRKVRGVIIVICIAVMCFGGWKIYSIRSEYSQGEQTYESLEAYVSAPESREESVQIQYAKEPETMPELTPEKEPEEEKIEFPSVDFDSLRKINPEIVGWICCENTVINYPVAQGTDNDYYLDHLFDGTPNGSGSIFMDKRNRADFSDPNIVIYGHNMRNGRMFADLVNYETQSFYEEHPRFLLMTPEKNYAVEIFAAMVVNEQDKVWQTDFSGAEEFEMWLKNNVSQSRISTGITPCAADQVVTLSTCSYEYQNARFVVMGILRER